MTLPVLSLTPPPTKEKDEEVEEVEGPPMLLVVWPPAGVDERVPCAEERADLRTTVPRSQLEDGFDIVRVPCRS